MIKLLSASVLLVLCNITLARPPIDEWGNALNLLKEIMTAATNRKIGLFIQLRKNQLVARDTCFNSEKDEDDQRQLLYRIVLSRKLTTIAFTQKQQKSLCAVPLPLFCCEKYFIYSPCGQKTKTQYYILIRSISIY
jgi:hypothetical protein